MTRTRMTLIVVGLFLLLGTAIGFALAPQSMSADLARVGQGRPAVVLAYENYSPASMDAMERLNRVRGDYAERVEFLVADLASEAGNRFAERHGLREGMITLFDAGGDAVATLDVPADPDALRRRLDTLR